MVRSRKEILSLIAFVTILAVVVPGVVAQSGEEESTPSFRVESAKIQLGTVAAGSDAVATFVFHNDSEKDVKIIRAKPS